MEIQHFSHDHPLTLQETELKAAVKCSGCDLPISVPFYDCTKCYFFIHKSCAELPRELDRLHILHPIPTHLLTLLPQPPRNLPTFNCYTCNKRRRGFAYHCPQCQRDFLVFAKLQRDICLCVNCISLIPPSNTPDELPKIRDPTHEHPLILCTKKREFDVTCVDCDQPIEDDSICLCPICILFLHKSCADPPRQISHPFHPRHPLALLPLTPDGELVPFRCKACGRGGSGRSYHCAECSFDMHVPCSRLVPTVKSDIHQHPLAFFNFYTDIKFRCDICDGILNDSFFRCVDCDFSLHLLCFPSLPQTVKHASHKHPLAITDSPIKRYSDDDDEAEFYCDACEKSRNLYDRTYYCAKPECYFVAHIKCLISEILSLLAKEWSLACKQGDTELDTSNVVKEKSDIGVISSLVEEPPLATSGSVAIEAPENPALAELDEEIAKLRVEIEVLTAKLGALERRRAHLAVLPQLHLKLKTVANKG